MGRLCGYPIFLILLFAIGIYGNEVENECSHAVCVIHASHNMDIQFVHDKTKTITEVIVNEGRNEICPEQPGEYSIQAIETSCFRFLNVYQWNTEEANELHLQATQYRLQGNIAAPDRTVVADLSAKIKSTKTGSESIEYFQRTGRFFFSFLHWADFDDQLEIAIEYNGDLFFYPPLLIVDEYESSTCPRILDLIVSRPGLYLEGKIDPIMEGVKVSVKEENTDNILLDTLSNENGEYKLGPLHDDKKYTLEANLKGYIFTRSEEGFTAAETSSETIAAENTDIIF